MNKEKGRLEKESNQQILVDLMKNHGDMVLRVAFTYVKDKQLAEDLSQEVFIRCYQSIHHFENRSSYKTWIYRITVNCCKDYVKSWSFRNIIPRSVVKRDNEQYLDSVISQIVNNEDDEILFNYVLKLSVKLREVIIFYYYEDLSIHEIANILDVSENTIKSRLFRARKSLQNYIEGEGGMILER
ncbi:sigma-70 family RNA polymerase sigma factor [Bacillus sp. SM2101]|uniref:sigma-70 family RNA polymerase sigma factor n=1 Tax=Bacillus sp. SM2101 TaxID=2805366 RepID=UPI002032B2E2|nr:sigma-70 family RNA polymerase sigma factor [Bacillus sp. SM2101]